MFQAGVVCSRGIGAERGGREKNEDNYLICRDGQVSYLDCGTEKREPGGGDGLLVAVCDGMGGHSDGDVAASAAVRVMAKLYRPGRPKDAAKALLRYVKDAHYRLYWRAAERGPVDMGTTLTVAWVLGDELAWAQVGDSRLYLFRDSALEQLTRDHTRNEFARRDARTLTPDGGYLAQNFIYGSRGLGDNAQLRLEAGLDAGTVRLQKGDRLILCTDGLWGSVDDASIAEVLRHVTASQAAAVALMERAIARGSTDNVTVVVVAVEALEPATGPEFDLPDAETPQI